MMRTSIQLFKAREGRQPGITNAALRFGSIDGDEVVFTDEAALRFGESFTTRDMGLGDFIARLLAPMGGDAFKEWCKRRGKPCNCAKRQAKLNQLVPFKS